MNETIKIDQALERLFEQAQLGEVDGFHKEEERLRLLMAELRKTKLKAINELDDAIRTAFEGLSAATQLVSLWPLPKKYHFDLGRKKKRLIWEKIQRFKDQRSTLREETIFLQKRDDDINRLGRVLQSEADHVLRKKVLCALEEDEEYSRLDEDVYILRRQRTVVERASHALCEFKVWKFSEDETSFKSPTDSFSFKKTLSGIHSHSPLAIFRRDVMTARQRAEQENSFYFDLVHSLGEAERVTREEVKIWGFQKTKDHEAQLLAYKEKCLKTLGFIKEAIKPQASLKADARGAFLMTPAVFKQMKSELESVSGGLTGLEGVIHEKRNGLFKTALLKLKTSQ